MLRIILMLLGVMLLAQLSQNRTNALKEEGKKDYLFYTIVLIWLCLFAGLRTSYNDTISYVGDYLNPVTTPDLNGFFKYQFKDITIGDNPAFMFLNSLMKTLNLNRYCFIMIYSVIPLTLNLWFIRKYTDDFSFAMFKYFTGNYFFVFAGIKQAVATSIVLIAVDAALSSKWVKYVFFLILATLFHPYSIMFIIVPFLLDKRAWSKITYSIIGVFFVLGATFPLTTRIMAFLATLIGDDFKSEELQQGGVNFIRFLVYFVCIVYYFVNRKILYDDDTREQNLFLNLSVFGSMFMFLSLFGNQILIGRLPSYFSTISVISLTYACNNKSSYKKDILKKDLSVDKLVVFILFTAFFLYEEFINRSFWNRYHAITLLKFIQSLF